MVTTVSAGDVLREALPQAASALGGGLVAFLLLSYTKGPEPAILRLTVDSFIRFGTPAAVMFFRLKGRTVYLKMLSDANPLQMGKART